MVTSSLCSAADEPKLSLGDKISIFSDKAYRKGAQYFEAIGNVVIISGNDTVYGELASLDQEKMQVRMEGNVRFVTKDLTLYGSHVEYNVATGGADIRNARIITSQYNLVASRLVRVSEDEYLAYEAEFTTCKDCAESWSVFGKTIRVKVGNYVQISHGLAKIKGVSVIYIPYIVLPILGKRKTGLLFPTISQRDGEGLSFEQPVFWAIDDSKDATISPTFWGKRGYGMDLQYRQRFSDLSWVDLTGRGLNDTIYEPGKTNVSESGETFFRYFADLESHQQFSTNFGGHARYTGLRDLDLIRDHLPYTETRTLGSDFGLDSNLHFRQDRFSISAVAQYKRNLLEADPLEFDRSYVQTLPRIHFGATPYSLLQSDVPGLQHVVLGLESSFTRFRQVREEESVYLRNADRLSAQPYINWHLFTWGPVSLKSRYILDYQSYQFEDSKESKASKSAGLMRTEVSFTMDKIFGLAYEEKIPLRNITEPELEKLRERKEQGLTPIKGVEREDRLVGELPAFETELTRETIVQKKNSYRHSQEFKLVHHYIANENRTGNQRFLDQINRNQEGWFDYEDAYREQEYLFGANSTRVIIPPENTVEFQWNNSLIRKSPRSFSYLEDDRYLRDNFDYVKVGYFNVSQGYLLNRKDSERLEDRLTRLMIETGYNAARWSVALQEYYFHDQQDNIFNINLHRRFDYFNIMGSYRYESYDDPKAQETNILSFGAQVRPTDILGLAMVKEVDFIANRDVRTVYSADIMPHNNCWIFNLNYRQTIVDSRYSFNVIFNFGQSGFERYRNDYFGVKRL